MRRPVIAAAFLTLAGLPAPASALCSYDGVLSAKTTLDQEFRDSRWVVRARLVSAVDHFSDSEDSWTLYRLHILRSYKGAPPRPLRLFTFRNSGGFYLDRPWEGHDIGGEYLLFLRPASRKLPHAAARALMINYSCGQSKRWVEVSRADRQRLLDLSRRDGPTARR